MASCVIAGLAAYYTPEGGTRVCSRKVLVNDLAAVLSLEAFEHASICHEKIEVAYESHTVTGTGLSHCVGCGLGESELTEGKFTNLSEFNKINLKVMK